MKWLIIPFAILVTGAGLEAHARCDAKFADEAALQPDWSFTPRSASDDAGPRQASLVLCQGCVPKVVATVRAVGGDTGVLTVDQVLADAGQKKTFLDWYIADYQRMLPRCEVGADIAGRQDIAGIAFATMYFGSRCQDQPNEYTSGIEYLGFKNSCTFRVTLLWPGNEPMPDASTSAVERLLRQIEWWN